MISFEFNCIKCLPSIMPNKYPELLKYEGEFIIRIEDTVYFQDTDFAIFEFLYYIRAWIVDKNQNMVFNSVETEDNPLISFIYTSGKWKIYSPWQNYECKNLFTWEEIIYSINILIKQLGY